jgi:hypothetical protein
MDALPNEMKTFDLPLVIKKFELEDPLEKQFVGELELFSRYPALVDVTNADD